MNKTQNMCAAVKWVSNEFGIKSYCCSCDYYAIVSKTYALSQIQSGYKATRLITITRSHCGISVVVTKVLLACFCNRVIKMKEECKWNISLCHRVGTGKNVCRADLVWCDGNRVWRNIAMTSFFFYHRWKQSTKISSKTHKVTVHGECWHANGGYFTMHKAKCLSLISWVLFVGYWPTKKEERNHFTRIYFTTLSMAMAQ